MDTVTQMLFGATIAQAGFRRRLGRRAALAGAAVALVPDLDIVVQWVAGPFPYWVHHRGLTHSLLFGPFIGPLFGWALWRWQRHLKPADPSTASPDALRAWIWLSVLALMTHPILDVFTSYGTQILWPLSDRRFAIDALPIIDPLYSLILLAALLVGAFAPRRPGLAEGAASFAVIAIAIYTAIAWDLNERVRTAGAAAFAERFGGSAEITAYPLLFQPYYRRILASTPDAAFVGYHSVLAPDRPIEWTEYRFENGPAIEALRGSERGRILSWFAMDKVLWRSEPGPDGTEIVEGLDLRYGMPGAEPSFWGVRAIFANGGLREAPEMFRAARPSGDGAVSDYLDAIFGN